MAKMNPLLKKILIGSGVAGGAAMSGLTGAAIGSHLMKKKLGSSFNAYNQQENEAIAQRFYEMGAKDVANMTKKSEYLEKIADAAFVDELEKIGVGSGIINAAMTAGRSIIPKLPGMAMKGVKALGQSFKGFGQGVVGAGRMAAEYGKPGYQAAKSSTIQGFRQSIPAAATLGLGGAFMAGRMSKKDQPTVNVNY